MFWRKELLGVIAFALLLFVGKQIAADSTNVNAIPLLDMSVNDRIWNQMSDSLTSGKASAKRTKIAADRDARLWLKRLAEDKAKARKDAVTSGPERRTKIAAGPNAKSVPLMFNTSTPSPDFNGDGLVGHADFLELVNEFGSSRGDGTYQTRYDLDNNGTIEISDFLIFADNFGKTVSSSATVTIADANLRAIIADSLGKSRDAPITGDEMATLTRIDAPNRDIRNLTGLEHAVNLAILGLGSENVNNEWINSNDISNLSPLSNLINLTWLNLNDNSISEISALSNLTNLAGLYLWNNSISDISALSNLTNLTGLDLFNNSISDISALSNLTNLAWLYLYNNSISEISALSNLTNLTGLYLFNNSISDISALSNLTNLERLWLYNNSISEISALSNLTNLTELYLFNNSISDISALSNLTNLTGLYLGDNSISEISALSNLTNLTGLDLYNNSISEISALSNLTNLTGLYLYNNSISDISALSNLTNLTRLDLDNNNISEISALSNLTNLIRLDLYNNSVSEISALSNLTNLAWLYLWNNSISEISALSNLTNLTRLYLWNNSISEISALSNLTNLTRLDLDNNNISDISPLVANTGLDDGDWVFLYSNPLSSTSRNTHIPTLQRRGVTVEFDSSSSGPDLIVESPSVSDSTLMSGQSFTLNARVRNQGTGQSAATTLQYYRSKNVTITSSDSLIGSDSVNGLSASGTSAESISLTAPSSAGTYYYGACVASVSGESDANNNCSTSVSVTVSSGSPDLIVESPSVSDSTLMSGQSFTLNVRVRNQGTGQSVATTLQYYRSANTTITSSDSPVGSDSVNGLSASGTSAESISLTAPSSAGTYYYGACVASVSGESDANNNCSTSVSITVSSSGSPDLIVESPSVSDSTLTTGQSFTLNARVRNQGNGQSAATTLQYYRSTNATITTGDTQVGTDSVSVLSASGTSAESISLTAPSSAGTYYYGACVASVSGESDANNNCSTSVSITVSSSGSPDLIVESPSVSDSTLTTGQSFTLSVTVRNQGTGQSAATTLQYHRSMDATITSSDSLVGSNSVSSLLAGSTSPESISLTAPSSAGTYYYGACVASVSGESDANNNCSTSVLVTVSSSGDGGNTYGVGESLPNFPSGIFLPIEKSIGANLSFTTGQAVLSLNNGDSLVLQDGTTYTCIASEGCGVEAGRVTSGTISVITGPSVDSSSPDLIVESASVSDSTLTTGQSFTLSVTVRNQGNGQSAVTTLRYYRSTDATISTGDTQVGTDPVSVLAASGTSPESISLTAPSSAGTYYYGACVTSGSGESNTNNNCSTSVSITVSSSGSPDLIVESASVSDSTLTTGQSFTLSVTVRNQGNGQSAVTTLRYYRSTDATISTGDTQVGTDPVSVLSASGTSAESISLTAPSSAGTYYYGACVASVSGESDTNNNCSSGVSVTVTVTIDPPPPPDEIDPPPPPTNVTYQLMNSEYWISWDPSLGATRYEIYFQALPFGNPSFSDNMEPIWVTAETTYKYDDYQGENVGCWVKACNAAGCSDHVKAERK